MNLLGAAAYDPSVAVSKATSSLLAMTAVDTTNLRLAITVPAHGKVRFRMSCTILGATTLPGILLGVMNGATVLKRMAPHIFSGTQDRATEMATAVAEFTATGLTPGAMNVDAAYAVQVIVASTNIKYGGPNDTTGADAFGAFVFEAWDPQPMPLAIAAGAAGGLLIAGANAATTFATLTSTGAFSVNGVTDVPQTGDNFARLGAPAGASVSADIAAVRAAELTGAQMATAIWADTVAGDFTTALSVGKSLMNGVALGTGLHIALTDTVTTYTGNTPQTGDGFARLGAPAGASHAADVAAVKADTAAIKIQTDKLTFTVANQIDSNVLDWKSATAPAMTGDAFARLGAPAGASVSADVAAVKVDTAAVKVQTDKLTFTVANQIDSNVLDWKSATAPAMTGDAFARIGAAGAGLTALGDTRIANLDTTVSSRSTYAGGAVASVTGAVGSVTAAVTVGTNNDKTGYALSAAGVQAIWDALTSALTTVGSIGKLLVTNIDAAISSRSTYAGGAVASVTGNVGGNVVGSVGSVTGAVGSVTGNVGGSVASVTAAVTVGTNNDKTGYALSTAGVQAIWDALTSALTTVGSIGKLIVTNLDALISSRSTYAGGAVASVTGNVGGNVVGSVASVTAAVTVSGDFSATMKTSLNAATPSVTVSDKTGFSLTQAFPSNFASLGIGAGGHILTVDTLTTYTGNTPQTGDSFARIGLAGVGLTNLGDARIAHLDADISSRLPTSSYTAPDNADITSIKSTLGVAGAGLTALGDARIAHLDADVSSRLPTSSYSAPPSALTIAADVWDVVIGSHLTSGTTGAALNGAGAGGDPWGTSLPGAYGAGTAGNIIGNQIDAAISSRLATSSYSAPPSAVTIAADVWDVVLASHLTSGTTGAALNGAGAAGDPWTTTLPGAYGAGTAGNIVGNKLDAAISSRLATSGYTAPDNADIVSIKAKTDNIPPDPADASDIAALFAAISSSIAGLNNISPAGVRAAVGLASANLDTQLAGIQTTADGVPTNAELATALASADDATLAAIAALSIPTAVAIANEVATRTLKANIKEINSVTVTGDGATTPWGPG